MIAYEIRKAEPRSPKINLTAAYKFFINLCNKFYSELENNALQ